MAAGNNTAELGTAINGAPPKLTPADWAEYVTPDGRRYYYNKLNKTTTWEKPEELKTPEERAMSCPWKEYTADSGRKYYYNSETHESVWEVPEELKAFREGRPFIIGEKKAEREHKKDMPDFKNKSEAAYLFRDLLESVGINSSWTWEMAMRATINDERYKSLKTLVERKACFQEYMLFRRKLEQEERKQKETKAKEGFSALLKSCKEINSRSTWRKLAGILEKDPRFAMIEDDLYREELFEDFVYEIEKKEKEEYKEQKRLGIQKFKQMLEESSITVKTQWRRFKDQYGDDQRYRALEKLDRLNLFEEYVRNLEKKDADEKKIRERENKKSL